MPESWEKWNKSGMRWSKTHKQVTFGATVCFNGCQTSKCLAAKHVMSGTRLEHAFFVLCPRLDPTDGIVNFEGQVNGE